MTFIPKTKPSGLPLMALALTSTLYASTPPSLIPQPSEVKKGSGPAFNLNQNTLIIHDAQLSSEASILAKQLRISTGFQVNIVHESAATGSQLSQPYIRLDLSNKSQASAHGYTFASSAKGIEILAKDATGVFHGTQTLLQLLPPEVVAQEKQEIQWSIPSYSITDEPRFQWRGMHLDESRHFFGKAFAKRYIDLLAAHKMNVFHWHLIDDGGWRIEIKKYPKLTEQGAWRSEVGYHTQNLEFPRNKDPKLSTDKLYVGFYTQEDIKEIVAYAQARHIRVIPEIEIPGHSLPALDAYPEHRCGGPLKNDGEGWTPKRQNSYCAGKESTYTFLQNVLSEVFTLFPDEYVHIGGDEVIKSFWKQCPDCQKCMTREGLHNTNELQSHLIRRIEKFLNQNGKKLIGWDEITHGGLTPNATVMFWIGMGAVPETVEKGHDIIMTPMGPCYFDYGYPSNETSKVYAWEPVPEQFLGGPLEKKFLGAQGNVWTENMHDSDRVEFMILPRMLAMAEILWSPRANRDYTDFSQRLNGYYPRLDAWGLNYRLPSPQPSSTAFLFKKEATVSFLSPPAGFTLRYTTDGSQPTLKSEAYSKPITVTRNTKVRSILARDDKIGPEASVECVKFSPPSKLDLEPGLHAEYAEGQWKRVPNFRTLENITRSKVKGPDLSIRKRNDHFACKFSGYIKINKAGVHHFTLASDDGSVLKLGGATVVNHDGPHGYARKTGSIELEAGVYPLEIGFLEVGGAERLDVFMTTPGGAETRLPENLLFRDSHAKPLPSVQLKTVLPTHKENIPELAIDGDLSTYFWSPRGPKKGDTFTVTLDQPVRDQNLTVITGKPDGKDKLNAGVLEISRDGKTWKQAAIFKGGKAETSIKSSTKGIRIRATKDQGNWLAIREIKLGNHPRTMFSTSKNIRVSGQTVQLTLTVDIEGSEDLKPRIKEMSDLFFSDWQNIVKALNAPVDRTPTHLFLSFREKMGFPAYVAGTSMVIEASHLRRHPDDTMGVFTHELTHFVQNYAPKAPGWFVEGTADYIRYKAYPDSTWAARNKAHTNKEKPLGAYWNSTAFLLWIEKNYKPGAVAIVSRACKEGTYSDEIWKKLTGKSLSELTEEYKQS